MSYKVLSIAALIAVCSAEAPTHQQHSSSDVAVSSQSFTRHDVPLSYKQTSTHPKYVAQEVPIVDNASPVSYVTPTPALYSVRTTSGPVQYSTAPSHYSTARAEQSSAQGLYTKVKSPDSPSENHPQAEFTQAYFLPNSYPQYQNAEQHSGHRQSESAAPQGQFYVTQQYSEGPALFQPVAQHQARAPQYQAQAPRYEAPAAHYQAIAVQYQSAAPQYQVPTSQYQPQIYQIAQHAPVKYVSVAQRPQLSQEYAHPPPQFAYRVAAAPSAQQFISGTTLKSIEYQVANNNGYEPSKAPVIAKFSPAAFMSQSFTKSTPVYIQSAPAYTKSTPVYTVPALTQAKSIVNYVQAAPETTKAQYVEVSQSSSNPAPPPAQPLPNYGYDMPAPTHSQATPQYVESSPPSHGQTTQLYAVPSNSRPYYKQHLIGS